MRNDYYFLSQMAASVGTAWLQLKPSMKGIASNIHKELGNGADKAADDASKSIDSKLASSAKKTGSKIASSIGDALKQAASTGVKAFAILGTATATSLGAFLKSSVQTANEFNDSLSELGYVSGATADEMQRLSKQAQELGSDIQLPGATASGAAQAMTELAKAGLNADQTIAASKGTMALAITGQMDFADAATTTVGVLNGYAMAADQAMKVSDLLAGAANGSSADVTDLGYALSYASQTGHNLGVPIEELTSALGLLANNGQIGTVAGTSLARAMTDLTAPTKAAAEELSNLGIKVYDEQGKFVGLQNVMEQLKKATADMTDEQKQAALNTIFTTNGYKAASILINQSTDAWDSMTNAVTKSGVAIESAASLSAPLSQQLDNLSGTLDNVKISAGNLATGGAGLEDFITNIQDFVSQITSLISQYAPSMINAISALVGRIGQALPGLIQTIMPSVISGIEAIVDGLSQVIPIILPAIGSTIVAIATSLSSPDNLQAILDGVIALVTMMIQALPTIVQNFVVALPSLINQLVTGLLQPGNIQALVQAAILLVAGIVQNIPTIILSLINAIPTIIGDLVKALTDPNTILQLVQGFIMLFIGVAAETPAILSALISSIINAITGMINNLISLFTGFGTSIGNGIGDSVKSAINTVLGWISGVVNTFIGAINGAIDLINKIPGVNIGKIAEVHWEMKAKGGRINGPGTGTSDSIPVLASNGEFMIKASSSRSVGYAALDYINQTGKLPETGGSEDVVINFGNGAIIVNGADDPEKTANAVWRKVSKKIADAKKEVMA